MGKLWNEKRTMEHRPHKADKQLSDGDRHQRNKSTKQLDANVAQRELLKEKQVGEPLNCTNSELDIYLRELEAGYLPTSCSGTNRSLLSKSKTIREKYWSKDKPMESCHSFQPLETSKTSTGTPGAEQLTFFAEDSHVRTSVRQVKEQELPGSVRDFGRNMRDSLERCGLVLSLPKTHLCFALGDLELSSKTCPRWGIMLDGECSELGMSVRHINETECGSWPTPRAGKTSDENEESWMKRNAAGKVATPPLTLAVKMKNWPTPAARDYKGANSREHCMVNGTGRKHMDQLPNAVAYGGDSIQQKAQLNPDWVEWLMGWPISWTSLEPLSLKEFRAWHMASTIASTDSRQSETGK
jgi:hypothetical protein